MDLVKKNTIGNHISNSVKNDILENLLLLGIFGSIIFPPMNINIGVSFYLFTPISFLLLLVEIRFPQAFKIHFFVVEFSFILFSILCSIFYSYLFLNVPSSYRDFLEFFRYFQILPYFFAIYYIDYDSFVRKINFIYKYVIIILVVIGILEYINFNNIGIKIAKLYSSDNQISGMISGSKRIIITAANPNNAAIILVFLLLLTIQNFLINRKKSEILFILCLIFLLLITQSRTAIFAFIISIIFYIVFVSDIKLLYKIFIIVIFFTLIFQSIKYLHLNYIIVGFKTLVQGTNTSFNVRYENLIVGIERFIASPIFGWGPAKKIHSTTVDSEYIMILQRYGLTGIISYMLYFFTISYLIYKNIKDNKSLQGYLFFIFTFFVVNLITMITNNIISGYQIGSLHVFFIILLGNSYKKNVTIKK